MRLISICVKLQTGKGERRLDQWIKQEKKKQQQQKQQQQQTTCMQKLLAQGEVFIPQSLQVFPSYTQLA